jgi:hypothetical protein
VIVAYSEFEVINGDERSVTKYKDGFLECDFPQCGRLLG